MRTKTSDPLEDFEIRPLFQIGRAAMSSPDYAPDRLTHEGMVLLLNIIEDKIFERGVEVSPPAKPRRADISDIRKEANTRRNALKRMLKTAK